MQSVIKWLKDEDLLELHNQSKLSFDVWNKVVVTRQKVKQLAVALMALSSALGYFSAYLVYGA